MLGKLGLGAVAVKSLEKLRMGQRDEFVTWPEQSSTLRQEGRDAHRDLANPQDLGETSGKLLGSL